VLCELVWVLRRAYRYPKRDVVSVPEQLLITAELHIEGDALARAALDAYRDGPADFSDYLLLLGNQAAGCTLTYSLNAGLARHPCAALPA
jgi:predicted nucleic-acid-binding protein